jgi:RNA 2',3'-cyclic 3'-phosphodiesterase
MRLFVAVEIDDRARRVAETAALELQDRIGPVLKARWVPPENMHLTVRFIGHVDDSRAPAVIDALAPPLDMPPFEIALGGCGLFPPRGAPRVIWIGLTQGLPSLALMHAAFNHRLRPFGFEPERRPFSAHLTLARLKDAPRRAGRSLAEALDRIAVPATRFQVSRATVFQSHLSSKGPRYEPVAFSPLKQQ